MKFTSVLKIFTIFSFMALSSFVFAKNAGDDLNGELSLVLNRSKPVAISDIAFRNGSKHLLSIDKKNRVAVWDMESGSPVYGEIDREISAEDFTEIKKKYAPRVVGSINAVDVSPDRKFTAVSTSKGYIKVFDQYDEEYQLIEVFSGVTTVIRFSLDGKMLYTGSKDGLVTVYDVFTGAMKNILKGPASSVTTIAVSDDGKYFAAGYKSGFVKVWNAHNAVMAVTFIQLNRENWASWNKEGYVAASKSMQGRIVYVYDKRKYFFCDEVADFAVKPDYIEKSIRTGRDYPEIDDEKLAAVQKTAYNDFGIPITDRKFKIEGNRSTPAEPFWSREPFRAAGVFLNQELPLTGENEYLKTKLGFGFNFEQKTELPFGISGTFTCDWGIRSKDIVYLWTTIGTDMGVFFCHNLSEKVIFQPELHFGMNYNNAQLNLFETQQYSALTVDLMLSPSLSFVHKMSEDNYFDFTVYTKMAFQRKDCVTNLGYRLGYKHRF